MFFASKTASFLLVYLFLLHGCVSHQPAWQERARLSEEAQRPVSTENELIIYVIPAPAKISYDSPLALLTSFFAASVDPTEKSSVKHAVGHVFLRLRCAGQKRLAGQTTDGNAEEKVAVRKHGYGLGYLGAVFRGKMDDPAVLEAELRERLGNGEIVYLRILLSEKTAQRLCEYMDEYVARGYDQWWGEANRPRFGEGGACASFAASVLEVGGLLRAEYQEHWTVSFRIPKELFGGPLFNQKVSVGAILERSLIASRWAGETEPHVACTLWEPTRIHDWILSNWKAAGSEYIPEKTQLAYGLRLDCRSIPTPREPFWRDPAQIPNTGGRQPGPFLHTMNPVPPEQASSSTVRTGVPATRPSTCR